ncbi:MAG: hypothetical protein ACLPQ0_07340 [Candidatus Binatus sp.]
MGEANINIATLHLGHPAAAQDAIAIVGVDQVVHEPIQQKLLRCPTGVREGTAILGSSRLIEFEVRDQVLFTRGSQRMYPVVSRHRFDRGIRV